MSEHGSEGGSGALSSFKGENGMMNIMLVVALVGSVASKYAPGLLAPLSGIISEPLGAILWAYTLMFFMYTAVGEDKDASEIMKKLLPILMIVMVAKSFFEIDVDAYTYMGLIILAPFLGKAARNLINGGAFKLMGKRFDKKKHPHWKDFFEEIGKGKGGDHHDEKHGGMNWLYHTSPTLLNAAYTHLVEMKRRTGPFNSRKSDFEKSVKNLARVLSVHVNKGNIALLSTTTKPEFDAVKFKKSLGGDMSFEETVKGLGKDVDKVKKAIGAAPLSTVISLDPALAAAIHAADLPAMKDDLLHAHTGKIPELEHAFHELEEEFEALESAYLVSGLLTLHSEELHKELESTKDLLKDTKAVIKDVKDILGKVA